MRTFFDTIYARSSSARARMRASAAAERGLIEQRQSSGYLHTGRDDVKKNASQESLEDVRQETIRHLRFYLDRLAILVQGGCYVEDV